MEFLYIDKNVGLDWSSLLSANSRDTVCVTTEEMRNSINIHGGVLSEDFEVLHAGLLFYEVSAYRACALASLNWHFLNPTTDRKSISWKASTHAVIFRKGILKHVTPSSEYGSIDVQVADVTYQILSRGGRVFFDPLLVTPGFARQMVSVSRSDEYLFVYRNLGAKNLAAISPLACIMRRFRGGSRQHAFPNKFDVIVGGTKTKEIGDYSAIIPTINRYDYLAKAIQSLLDNPRPPSEIIIVDQTPSSARIPGYYDNFDRSIVKVFYEDIAGQCRARNRAVKEASREWLLLFDDDSEAWPEMITEHIALLERSLADVSTGVSLAPWKDRSYIKDDINFYHVSSVLDTGNCFLKRDVIREIGMFDPAFDRGSGADDNLGKRLYLSGKVIVFNPAAIRTHHKASSGGLRVHGAWWKNRGTLWGPFPLPTESYNFLTFYPRKFYLRLCLYKLFTSYRRSGFLLRVVNTVLFPWKVFVSYQRALLLIRGGHR